MRVVRKFRPEGRRHVRMNPDRERIGRVRGDREPVESEVRRG